MQFHEFMQGLRRKILPPSTPLTPAQVRAKLRAVVKHNANVRIPNNRVITRQMIRASGRKEAKRILSLAKLRAHEGELPGGSAAVQ